MPLIIIILVYFFEQTIYTHSVQKSYLIPQGKLLNIVEMLKFPMSFTKANMSAY